MEHKEEVNSAIAKREVNSAIAKSDSADYISIEGPKVPTSEGKIQTEVPAKINKSVSLDTGGEHESDKKHPTLSSGSFKRRSIRRRSSKRSSRPEPECGHDTETYEKIRERVLQERAVTNAIDALQERWRMIMFMYEDCVDLNKQRAECKLKKLCIKRQFELIMIILSFILVSLQISVIFILIAR
ncbi:uncharacterized protein LOC132729966 [Ruditapes philippinarum]|uniref:uncharacterized protein LOC132729966 n=1 Tax=Ruditapes philippinarum TaxID=129788 RepID=UPI00295BEFF4|nr:uncharacterized protein LOC132729966 [Ruditapes philippinarum]